MQRRQAHARLLRGLCGGLALCAVPWRPAHAGTQIEEPLADSVRTALSAAIAQQAPPEPHLPDSDSRQNHEAWLSRSIPLLRQKQAQIHSDLMARELLQTIAYESQRAALDLAGVMGVIEVESHFRKFAISLSGARGYMQVMPFWTRLIGDGDASRLFHTQTNLRFGCVILRHYLQLENGQLALALGRYNGSRGQTQYPQKVFAAMRHWR